MISGSRCICLLVTYFYTIKLLLPTLKSRAQPCVKRVCAVLSRMQTEHIYLTEYL